MRPSSTASIALLIAEKPECGYAARRPRSWAAPSRLRSAVGEKPVKKHPLFDEASKVAAEKGEVVIDGPDGVAVSLTPEAAIETGERLQDSGVEAAGQRRLGDTGPTAE